MECLKVGGRHHEIDHAMIFPDIPWASDYNPRKPWSREYQGISAHIMVIISRSISWCCLQCARGGCAVFHVFLPLKQICEVVFGEDINMAYPGRSIFDEEVLTLTVLLHQSWGVWSVSLWPKCVGGRNCWMTVFSILRKSTSQHPMHALLLYIISTRSYLQYTS